MLTNKSRSRNEKSFSVYIFWGPIIFSCTQQQPWLITLTFEFLIIVSTKTLEGELREVSTFTISFLVFPFPWISLCTLPNFNLDLDLWVPQLYIYYLQVLRAEVPQYWLNFSYLLIFHFFICYIFFLLLFYFHACHCTMTLNFQPWPLTFELPNIMSTTTAHEYSLYRQKQLAWYWLTSVLYRCSLSLYIKTLLEKTQQSCKKLKRLPT